MSAKVGIHSKINLGLGVLLLSIVKLAPEILIFDVISTLFGKLFKVLISKKIVSNGLGQFILDLYLFVSRISIVTESFLPDKLTYEFAQLKTLI